MKFKDLLSDASVSTIDFCRHDHVYVEKKGRWQSLSFSFKNRTEMSGALEELAQSHHSVRESGDQIMIDRFRLHGKKPRYVILTRMHANTDLEIATLNLFDSKDVQLKRDLTEKMGMMSPQIAELLSTAMEFGARILLIGGLESGAGAVLRSLAALTSERMKSVHVGESPFFEVEQANYRFIARMDLVSQAPLLQEIWRTRPDWVFYQTNRATLPPPVLEIGQAGYDLLVSMRCTWAPNEGWRVDRSGLLSSALFGAVNSDASLQDFVDLVVEVQRLPDGSRKVVRVSEPLQAKKSAELQDLFVFKEVGLDEKRRIIGEFQPSGHVPAIINRWSARGATISHTLFS